MSELPSHRDFSEFLQLLNAHKVRYLVVGAYAVAANGRPRFTSDLDVLVEPTKANAKRVIAALDAFGFPASSFRVEDFAEHDRVVMLGRKPVRIDLLTHIPEVVFRDAYRRRITARVAEVDVPVLGRDDLIRTKRASGRPKDLLDVALLEETIAEEDQEK